MIIGFFYFLVNLLANNDFPCKSIFFYEKTQ